MKKAFSKIALRHETHTSANRSPSLTLQAEDHHDSQIITVVGEVTKGRRNAAN